MTGSNISGDYSGTGVTTAISLASADSITAAPNTINAFYVGMLVGGVGLAVDHFVIANCRLQGVRMNGSNTTLAYCTVANNGDIGVYDASAGSARLYNSIVAGSPRPIYSDAPGMYCNYVDAWGIVGSTSDPFGSALTGSQNASFYPGLASDYSLNPASLFTNYSVSGGQIGAYGPGAVGPTPILAASVVDAAGAGGVARVRWFSEATGNSKAGIFRRTADGEWQPLTVLYPDGQGYVTLEDREVLAGTRYCYGVGVQRDGHVGIEGEVWVTVEAPISGLALAAIEPNPATTSWGVTFMSPEAVDSRIELIDLSGRVVRTLGLGAIGVGRQTVSLPAQGLSPGVYWVRVRQGNRSVLAKAIKTN